MASHTHNLSPFGDSAATLDLVSMRPFQVIKPLLEHAIMKRRQSTISVLLLFSARLLSACVGGGSSGGGSGRAANVPPSADISAPNSANERTSAVISGTGSSDSDGSIAAYQWSLDNPDNINVCIENPTQANAKLV